MSETIKLFNEDHTHALSMLENLQEALDILRQSRDLHAVGEGLQEFADFLEIALKTHFRQEEVALFPVMIEADKNAAQPVEAMLEEHRIIEAAHGHFSEELLSPQPNLDVILENGRKIIEVLTGHINREDKALFPFALRILAKDMVEEVERRRRQMDGG